MKNFLKSLWTNKKRLAIVVVILAIAGYFVYKHYSAPAQTTRYVTAAAAKTTIISTITGTGQVQAQSQLDVKPQTDGRLTTVNVKQNDQVKKGDVLGIIDQQSAANSVAQAKASLEQAQANYDKLMAGATANTIATSQLSIQSAQQALDQAKTSYNNTVTTQQQAVDKAYSNMLNDSLEIDPSDTQSTVTLTLTGNYTGKTQGSYIISTSQTGGGYSYNITGLGSNSGPINRGLPMPLGNGLYVTFAASGTISPSTSWTINIPNTKASGYLNDLNAYTTTQQTQTNSVQSAQDAITAAQNNLDKANLSYQATVQPPTDSDIASAKAQITSAQSQLANAETAYQATVLTAPFDGVVAAVDFAAGDKMTAGSTFATIITQQRVAKITLNEVDVAKIKLGQKATMTFDAIPDLQMTGSVAQIDTLGTVSQGVVSYNVQIALDTSDDRIKPGMSVSANVITDVAADTLSVPSSAVKSNAAGSYVQILGSNGQPQNKAVQVGISDDTNTQILSGLNEGDQVVTQTITSAKTTTAATTGSVIPGLGGGGGAAVFRATGGGGVRGN